MPFVPLLLLVLLNLQTDWPPAPFDLEPAEAIVVSLSAQSLVVLAAALLSIACRLRYRAHPGRWPQILRTYARGRFRLSVLAVAVFLGCLYGLGWGWAMKLLIVGWWTPLLKPALLLPYLVGMVMTWFFYYETDRAAHDDFWGQGDYQSRSSYLLLHLRQNLILLIPPLLFVMGQETLHEFLGDSDRPDEMSLLYVTLLISLLVAGMVFLPYLLRLILGLRPLPAGPVRDHLTATARRLGFRISDILVWNTRDTQANALVTGMAPFLRYVVFTDRLLREMSMEELEAVFGHEVGHIKHRHLAFYTLFLLFSVEILGVGFQLLTDWVLPTLTELSPTWAEALGRREWFLVLLVTYVFLCFGYLSRRCERQADLFGCHVAGFPALISALEKVDDINGTAKHRRGWLSSWLHGTISERVDFLRLAWNQPEVESAFERRFAWLRWGSMASLAVVVGVLVVCQQFDWLKLL